MGSHFLLQGIFLTQRVLTTKPPGKPPGPHRIGYLERICIVCWKEQEHRFGPKAVNPAKEGRGRRKKGKSVTKLRSEPPGFLVPLSYSRERKLISWQYGLASRMFCSLSSLGMPATAAHIKTAPGSFYSMPHLSPQGAVACVQNRHWVCIALLTVKGLCFTTRIYQKDRQKGINGVVASWTTVPGWIRNWGAP